MRHGAARAVHGSVYVTISDDMVLCVCAVRYGGVCVSAFCATQIVTEYNGN